MNDTRVFSDVLDGVDDDTDERLLPHSTFALFDPLTGQPPTTFFSQFSNIVHRARALLSGWDANRVMEAADYLAFLLNSIPPTEQSAGAPRPPRLRMEAPQSSLAQAAAIWHRHDKAGTDPTHKHSLSRPYWPGIFAAYALAQVGLARRCCGYAQPVPAPVPDSAAKERFIAGNRLLHDAWPLARDTNLSRETVAHVAVYALIALEAVCCAEALVSSERKIATERSAHATKAAAAKHAKTQALKRRVRELYDADPDFAATKVPPLSSQRVADIIYDHKLTAEERSRLSGRHPSRTLARWIADFRREP